VGGWWIRSIVYCGGIVCIGLGWVTKDTLTGEARRDRTGTGPSLPFPSLPCLTVGVALLRPLSALRLHLRLRLPIKP
jgi:hypothetical protein